VGYVTCTGKRFFGTTTPHHTTPHHTLLYLTPLV
jgi:hypothetical protein